MWLWLGLSGLAGFTFGDLCLFRAYVEIGSRLGTLTMLLVPLITTALGWALLGETLQGRDALGMILTVAGVGWAILERKVPERPSVAGGADGARPPATHPHLGRGLLLGFGGALGQAVGLVLSKGGMEGYPAIATAQVRVIAGLAAYLVIFTVAGWWGRVARACRNLPALAHATGGAFFGPFVGVSLSLVAVAHTVSGVAATLMALTPIFVIPIVYLVRGERVGAGGIGGALIAVGGAALLLL
jgi:drug/metabolite transporter (DMT)-like permease